MERSLSTLVPGPQPGPRVVRWPDVPEVRGGGPRGAGCSATGGRAGARPWPWTGPGWSLLPPWGRGGALLLRGRYGAWGMDGVTECPERRDVTKQQSMRKLKFKLHSKSNPPHKYNPQTSSMRCDVNHLQNPRKPVAIKNPLRNQKLR